MRPIASTWVASMQNIAAPERARLLMWVKCQSVAEPSSAEYWHIGETMMRLASFRPRNSIGANRALMRGMSGRQGTEGWRRDIRGRRSIDQPSSGRYGHARLTWLAINSHGRARSLLFKGVEFAGLEIDHPVAEARHQSAFAFR